MTDSDRVRAGCRRCLRLQSFFSTSPRTRTSPICGSRFRRPTGLGMAYFLFGLGTDQRRFIDDLGCESAASEAVDELVAFGKTSLFYQKMYFSQISALDIFIDDIASFVFFLDDGFL